MRSRLRRTGTVAPLHCCRSISSPIVGPSYFPNASFIFSKEVTLYNGGKDATARDARTRFFPSLLLHRCEARSLSTVYHPTNCVFCFNEKIYCLTRRATKRTTLSHILSFVLYLFRMKTFLAFLGVVRGDSVFNREAISASNRFWQKTKNAASLIVNKRDN